MINIDADREMTFEEAIDIYRVQVAGNRWGHASGTLIGMRPDDAIQVVKMAHAVAETTMIVRKLDVRRLISEIGFESPKLKESLRAYLATLQQAEGPIAEAAEKLDE